MWLHRSSFDASSCFAVASSAECAAPWKAVCGWVHIRARQRQRAPEQILRTAFLSTCWCLSAGIGSGSGNHAPSGSSSSESVAAAKSPALHVTASPARCAEKFGAFLRPNEADLVVVTASERLLGAGLRSPPSWSADGWWRCHPSSPPRPAAAARRTAAPARRA